MNKKYWTRRISLTLLFSATYIVFMIITMLLMYIGSHFIGFLFFKDAGARKVPLISFIITTLIVGTLISLIFSKIPLKPVKVMIDAINKLAKGDFTTRIFFRGPEVLNELSYSFNHMAQELESTEMLRTDFIDNFSHEFKTPIVSIRGFAKILKDGNVTDEQKSEYLDIIISESERLNSLANNVLISTKLEHQRILNNVTNYNVTEQLRLAISLLENSWDKKNITFDFDCDEIFINANSELLNQVWINLLVNAIKFSNQSGVISINIFNTPKNTYVQVSNTGNHIPMNLWTKVFDKFYQGDSSRSIEGNGLGLAIAKRIMDLHNGTICIKESNAEVTIFQVEIPRNIS